MESADLLKPLVLVFASIVVGIAMLVVGGMSRQRGENPRVGLVLVGIGILTIVAPVALVVMWAARQVA